MIEFVPLQPAHLGLLPHAEAARYCQPTLASQHAAQALCVPGLAYAGRIGDLVIGAAGIVPRWPDQTRVGTAWTMLTAIKRREWPAITAMVGRVLAGADELGYRRIEAHVDAEFAAACRWIVRLGFALETPEPMRAFSPDGRDHFLYARVR